MSKHAYVRPLLCLVVATLGGVISGADDLRVVQGVRDRSGRVGRSFPPPAPVGKRTGKFTLMALGDNRVGDLAQISHRYDLMIASHRVRREVIATFRQRKRTPSCLMRGI